MAPGVDGRTINRTLELRLAEIRRMPLSEREGAVEELRKKLGISNTYKDRLVGALTSDKALRDLSESLARVFETGATPLILDPPESKTLSSSFRNLGGQDREPKKPASSAPPELVVTSAGALARQHAVGAGTLIRPRREDFGSEDGFDAAFLEYQDARMAKLRERYPGVGFSEQIFHGSDLPPEVVFKTGLPRKGEGDNFDLRAHQGELYQLDAPPEKRSALRGGCSDARICSGLAGEGYWVYKLVPRGGTFPLEQALGAQIISAAAGEAEHAFAARQPGSQVYSAFRVGAWSDVFDACRLGPEILNPDFKPVF